LPAAAKGTSVKAAKAFVRYWVDTLNYAVLTGDTVQLRDSSGPFCKSCKSVTESIEAVYGRGGRFEGKGWVVRGIRPVGGTSVRHPTLQTAIRIHPQTMISKAGAKPQQRKGGNSLMVFTLSAQADSWIVMSWEQSS
jgi:hypothetical protein